ncbi:pyrroline-5-carboxylate reductase [Bacillus lacus]|uniref:Pyrroline-5-carboxylate reductase n=1 Tax=Metabacillus lacus TaxID=1983721 RepID=A0A7X2J2I5_9BACI|nr:pyrroline-5-carboxylate reductase [Metabacillus lacus]MRX74281.1 pyrroline-5-carboxylate reductase [Metabacillus lacus]
MKKIAFLGAGSMAEAMISGFVNGGLYQPAQIGVTNRSNTNRLLELSKTYGVSVTDHKKALLDSADIIILAMKPKDAQEALLSIREFIEERHLVISVLAGVTISSITTLLQKDAAVIRAMPNTSASVRMSATAMAVNSKATLHHIQAAKQIFETIGMVTLVEEEKLDAVTGLSGSGPAYIYYIVEAMEQAALEVGLEKEMARNLILQTLAGASEMLLQTNKQPSDLRREVTSPGGTTEAGIQALQNYQLQEAIVACVKSAVERSKELRAGQPAR